MQKKFFWPYRACPRAFPRAFLVHKKNSLGHSAQCLFLPILRILSFSTTCLSKMEFFYYYVVSGIGKSLHSVNTSVLLWLCVHPLCVISNKVIWQPVSDFWRCLWVLLSIKKVNRIRCLCSLRNYLMLVSVA